MSSRERLLRIGLILIAFFPVVGFAQIGTNPANPGGGVSGSPGITPGSQTPKFKSDSGVQRVTYYARSIKRITEKNLNADSLTLSTLDTTLNGYEYYSPLYQPYNYQINLGNLGLASTPLIPSFMLHSGFNSGQHALDIYMEDPSKIDYYRAKSPYTSIFYITGGKHKEQVFSFVHTQNVSRRFNIGIQYYRTGSIGYFAHQKADVLHFSAFAWYQSRNLRYNLISNIVQNTIFAYENGGIQNDSLFTRPTPTQHPYQSAYINAQTRWNQFNFYLKQYYYIGRIDTVRDERLQQYNIYPTARATYTLHYQPSEYDYDDNFNNASSNIYLSGASTNSVTNTIGSTYYPNLFLDSLATHDRTKVNRFTNEFSLSLFSRSRQGATRKFSASGIRLNASIKDEYIRYKQYQYRGLTTVDSTFNNVSLTANAGYDLSNRFSLVVDGSSVIIGPNHLDAYVAATGTLKLGEDIGSLKTQASFQNNQPDLIFNRVSLNSYRWTNHFSKVQVKRLFAEYENYFLRLRLSAELNLINGYTYFQAYPDTPRGVPLDLNQTSGLYSNPPGLYQNASPAQYNGQVRILRAIVDKNFYFWKMGVLLHGVYQNNNAQTIVRTPQAYGAASIFVENLYFKVLRIRLGVDAFYYSRTYLYNYVPGIQQFVVAQGNEGKSQYGNYTIADAFLVAGLKRVRFILKYDYLNQGHPSGGYYTVQHYPAPDHLFKFGLSWNFYD